MPFKQKRRTAKPSRQKKKPTFQITLTMLWRAIRKSWHVCRAFLKAVWASPPLARATIIPILLFLLWFGTNWLYHTLNKPSELFFPLDRSLNKHPVETWKQYEPLFRENATAIITPDFLAALAQVEGAGNPVARTYWRWQLSWNPLEWYSPASSAVGMFQITEGTFREAKRYCIHDHKVVEDGAWHNWESCWFNSLYTRVVPSHAIELTSAYLDRRVTKLLGRGRLKTTTLRQKQDLAAVIHLCGAGAGRAYVARGLHLAAHQQCGAHNVSRYLKRLNVLKKGFDIPRDRSKTIRQAR